MSIRLSVALPHCALAAATVVAQAPPPPTFRAETRLVVLQATVKGDRGALITDLTRDAFTVYEDGRPQPIMLFRRDDVPLSVGLLIDNSGSMRLKRSKVEAAALAFVRASNPLDEVFVVNFADKVRLDVGFTNDPGILEAGLARVDSVGGTAMRDALYAAQQYLQDHASRDRRVLLVVTDGNDNASTISEDEVQRLAEERGVAIYAVGLLNEADRAKAKQARRELDRLTATTGGFAYYPESLDDVGAVTVELARQIRHQYTIAYAPLNQALDGRYRTIRVVVKGRERFVVQTRAGYRAVRQPGD